jgi:membrane fusion protein (multidrug efflux system)
MRQFPTLRGLARFRAAAPALFLLLALTACKGGNGAAEAKETEKVEAVPVEVAPVRRHAVAASYTGTAPLEARAESQVVAKTSEVALDVLVEVGDKVEAGQTLVRLDSDRLRLQVAQSAAQMHKLENEFERAQQLVKQQLLSTADFDRIRFDLENARATHRMAQLELSYATVEAPISGVVAQVSIKPGNFVQINTPIIRIVDTDRLEATLNVPERELATMQAGLPVTLRVDALPGKTFEGTIDRVSPVVDAGSGTFRVVAAFAGQELLQPGMFGRISIDYDKRADALVVPRTALLDDTGNPAVFRVRDGKVARVPVELGYIDGPWAEVREGLEPGDRVVVAGKSALRDGTVVQVIGEPAAKAQVAEASTDEAGNRQ